MFDFSGPLARGLVVFTTDTFHNRAPLGNIPGTVDMGLSSRAVAPGMFRGWNFPATTDNNHFILDNAGNPILGNLKNCTLLIWFSGATSSNRTFNGNTVYSERATGTPIWKYSLHGDQGAPDGLQFPDLVHRDDGGTLTYVSGNVSVEDGKTHLTGFTKAGTSVIAQHDGHAAGTGTLGGNDTLALTDPSIGWDIAELTTRGSTSEPVYAVMGWNRTLTPNEIAEVFALKSDIFRPQPRYYLPTAAAGGFFNRHYYDQLLAGDCR